MANGEGYKTGGGGKKQPFGDNGQYVEKGTAKENVDRNGSYRQNTGYQAILDNDKRREAVKKYSDDPGKDGKSMGIRGVPEVYNFNRLKTRHHLRHVQEMGFKNEKEYFLAAKNYWNSDRGTYYRGTLRGEYAKYDSKTGEYFVCSPEGKIHTYYLISKKKFEKIKIQEGYEEWEK